MNYHRAATGVWMLTFVRLWFWMSYGFEFCLIEKTRWYLLAVYRSVEEFLAQHECCTNQKKE